MPNNFLVLPTLVDYSHLHLPLRVHISDPKTTNRKQKKAIYTPELIGRMTEEMLVHKATPIEITESRIILGMPEDVYSFESVKKRAEKLFRELTQSKSTLHSPYLLLLIPFFLVRVCKGGCWQSLWNCSSGELF
jgi:hypothetical protein